MNVRQNMTVTSQWSVKKWQSQHIIMAVFQNWRSVSIRSYQRCELDGVSFTTRSFFYSTHRQTFHIVFLTEGPINSYHSFWWNNLILFLYNVDTLNICMKEFGSEKIIFDKITSVRTWTFFPYMFLLRLLYRHWWCLHGRINFYHSLKWNNLILCLYYVNTLNICM